MKKTIPSVPDAPALIVPPTYPFSGPLIFAALRSELQKALPDPMPFQRLARLAGISTSKAYWWFEAFDHPHIRAFFCYLEYLPREQRHAFVDRFCRTFPTLQHSGLQITPAKMDRLLKLCSIKTGLTFVTGTNQDVAYFLAAALARECQRRTGWRIAGLGINPPPQFVPLDSVTHFVATRADWSATVQQVWPRLQTSRGRVIMLSGLWHAIPELQAGIVRCARANHVIIADNIEVDLRATRFCGIEIRHRIETFVRKSQISLHLRQIKS